MFFEMLFVDMYWFLGDIGFLVCFVRRVDGDDLVRRKSIRVRLEGRGLVRKGSRKFEGRKIMS